MGVVEDGGIREGGYFYVRHSVPSAGFHRGPDYGLLAYEVVWTCRCIPTFRRDQLTPFLRSGIKSGLNSGNIY